MMKWEALNSDARIWIYQSDRIFTKEEEALIINASSEFINNWAAHGKGLKASFTIEHECFLIIGVDESTVAASGCSIDTQTHFIKDLGNQLNINFFERLNIVSIKGNQKSIHSLSEMKQDTSLYHGALYFDNTIQRKSDLSDWIKKTDEGWLANML